MSYQVNDKYLVGKGIIYEVYSLVSPKTNQVIAMPDWEWADLDGKRIVWAEKGKIMAGKVDKTGLGHLQELFDANPFAFTELTAPY